MYATTKAFHDVALLLLSSIGTVSQIYACSSILLSPPFSSIRIDVNCLFLAQVTITKVLYLHCCYGTNCQAEQQSSGHSEDNEEIKDRPPLVTHSIHPSILFTSSCDSW